MTYNEHTIISGCIMYQYQVDVESDWLTLPDSTALSSSLPLFRKGYVNSFSFN